VWPYRLIFDESKYINRIHPSRTIGRRGFSRRLLAGIAIHIVYSMSPDTRELQTTGWQVGLIIRAAVVFLYSVQNAKQIAGGPGPAVRAC
jgi:hypothetical protein